MGLSFAGRRSCRFIEKRQALRDPWPALSTPGQEIHAVDRSREQSPRPSTGAKDQAVSINYGNRNNCEQHDVQSTLEHHDRVRHDRRQRALVVHDVRERQEASADEIGKPGQRRPGAPNKRGARAKDGDIPPNTDGREIRHVTRASSGTRPKSDVQPR